MAHDRKLDRPHLKCDVVDRIATITFDRADKLNAFTRTMSGDLISIFDRLDAEDEVRVIVITGSGRAFCAGADLGAPDSSFADDSIRDFGGRITLRIFESLKPVIFAINGPAVGMGATMSLAADVRLASTIAKFGFPFARRGIVPESASSWFLPRIVGISRALEWTLTGRTFLADEALGSGLVRSLHQPEDLMPAASLLAREIADHTAPVSVALTRQLLWRMLGADHPMEAHRIESRSIYTRTHSRDLPEGVQSFFEKRRPHFTDRVSSDMPEFFPWWTSRRYE
jgi:enoyl-CoA hydratase/carnithine racemase